jgi:hypothetical protein
VLDELMIHQIPVLFGGGRRLFGALPAPAPRAQRHSHLPVPRESVRDGQEDQRTGRLRLPRREPQNHGFNPLARAAISGRDLSRADAPGISLENCSV